MVSFCVGGDGRETSEVTLSAVEETLAILADEEAMADIAAAEEDILAGRLVPLDRE